MTHAQRIAFLELDHTMQSGRAFTPIYIAQLVVLALFMYGAVQPVVLVLWCLNYLLYIAARTRSSLLYRLDPDRQEPGRVRHWRRVVTLSGAGHGVVLGSLAFIALPLMGENQILLLTWTVMAIVVVGSVFTAPLRPASHTFMFFTVVPYLAAWLLSLGGHALPVGPLMLIGCGIYFLMSQRYYAVARSGFELILSNEDLARELEAKVGALALANSSKARLIANASHDLRQPIHALGLIVERLGDEVGTSPQWRALDSMKSAVGLASEMLTELMDWTRLDAGNYEPDLQPVAVGRLFEEVRLVYGMSAAHKGLSLDIDPCDLVVRSDRHLLRRMLLNLTSNAIKYTRHGSVRLACAADGQGHALLSVIDTGIGVPANKRQAIFEDFVRLGSGPENPEGLGIGLPIVRQAAQLLGHALQVRSPEAGGSEFSIRCPIAAPVLPEAEGAERVAAAPFTGAPRRVLVLENDAFSLSGMVNLVEKWGYTTLGAPHLSGVLEQLTQLPEQDVCLIISDFHLDEQENGLEAIATLRETLGLAQLPALLITGDLESSLPARASAMGVVLMHKPLSPARLRQTVETLAHGTPGF